MNRREFMGTGVALLAPRLTVAGDGETPVPPANLPGLRYHPEGDAIVVHNGGQSYNRPLYCHRIWPVVYAGDKPQLLGLDWAGGFGRLSIGIIRQGKGVWLHDFQDITSRYRPGRMEWLLRDERLAGLTLTLEAVTLEKGAGFAVKLRADGATGQDTAVWAYGDARAASGPLGSQSSWESLADAQLLYQLLGFRGRV